MKLSIKDRHVVLTGGTGGIGRALSQELIREGATVSVWGRGKERLEKLQGVSSTAYCDLSDLSSVEAAVRSFAEEGRRVDILINAAGVLAVENVVSGDHERSHAMKVFNTNVVGPIVLINEMLPLLFKSESPVIVNIGSPAGLAPVADFALYSSTKAALHAYTVCLREQLRDTHVRVVEVFPPAIDTPLMAGYELSKGDAAVYSKKLLRRLKAGSDEIYTGEAVFARYFSRLMPRLSSVAGSRFMRSRMRPVD